MYWTVAQMVAHHTVNGCNLRPGDLLGTGTISGDSHGSLGSLLEITRDGAEPITLPNGETRTFVEDGDMLTLHGRAVADGFVSIGFGRCTSIITPAVPASGSQEQI
jgi:fumarylacetoacetase